jgi:hypothetical protein
MRTRTLQLAISKHAAGAAGDRYTLRRGGMVGLIALAAVVGCGRSRTTEMGSARVTVQALQIGDIGQVKVTVNGSEIPAPLPIFLVSDGTRFSAVVSDIPIGHDYSFTAVASDKGTPPVAIYTGVVTGQAIGKNSTANIVIDMNQVASVVPLSEGYPMIDALTDSSPLASWGDSIQLKAVAHDPDAGQTAQLTFNWSPTCGTVNGNVVTAGNDTTPSTENATFIAPNADGACTITLTVTDPTGHSTTASFAIGVADSNATGNAHITANLNTCPVVTGVAANPAELVPGGTTSLGVLAMDPDGDALTYAWSTACPGSFSSPDASSTTFTLSASATDTSCEFTVVVSDGNFPDGRPKGCLITSHVGLYAKPIVVQTAPVITLDYQNGDSFVAGSMVGMAVAAKDPAGGILTYAWTTTFGPAPTATTPAALGLDPSRWNSAATFSSPTQPAPNTAVIVTVTATSSITGLSASDEFVLIAAPPCQCNGNGPGNVAITVVCGQTTCGSDYMIYSCGASGFTLTSQSCTSPPPSPPCQCTGAGPGNVPLTVGCGESACGSDYNIYACSASGWTSTGQSCAAGACVCNGTGPGNAPITAPCGGSACGSDYNTYSCSASGWALTSQSCAPTPVCECTGGAPGGASITIACGQSACGADYNIYACSGSSWTKTGYVCTPQPTAAPPCRCSGNGPGNVPIAVGCGQSTCGSDYNIYACSASGFTLTSQSCTAAPPPPPCQCTGAGPGNVPLTVGCGEPACGSDYNIYSCSASGWAATGQSCATGACVCNGMGTGNAPITAACGQSACGSDYSIYSCSASGWALTSQSCAPTPVCQCTGAAPGGSAVTVACGQSTCGENYMIYACSASGWTLTNQSCAP